MEENSENVPQYHGGDVLMSIKTEPEIIYEREDNANSTTGLHQQVKREHTMDANEFEIIEFKRAKKCCHNCLDLKSYIDHLFQKQSEKIQENKVEIMQALEVQKDLTIRLLLQQQTGEDLKSAFPLTSQEALIQFDRNINDDNKHLYVNAMKELIRNNLFKNMAQLIAEDLVYNYNVDGSHGKQSFKDLNNFYSALKSAVAACPEIDDVEAHIRKAVNLVKKRHLKKLLKEKRDDNRETDNSLNNSIVNNPETDDTLYNSIINLN